MEIFATEWRRAKRILSPYLDYKKIPRLFMSSGMSRLRGFHRGNEGIYAIRPTRKMRMLKGSHLIVLSDKLEPEQMKRTMRHEICHVIEQNHGSRFKLLLTGLQRSRELEEKIISGN